MELIAVHNGSWPKHTVWLARRKAKVVFAEHEKVKSISYQCNPNKFEAHLQDKGGVGVIMKVQDIQKSQKMPPKLQELADRAGKEGMSQTRSGGGGEGECEKMRTTLEFRHAVLNYLKHGEDLAKGFTMEVGRSIPNFKQCFADRNGDRTRRPIQRRCRGDLTKMDGEAPCEETSRRWMEKILAQQRTAAEKIQRR